jgi:Co/Zn/Cd efflux system component
MIQTEQYDIPHCVCMKYRHTGRVMPCLESTDDSVKANSTPSDATICEVFRLNDFWLARCIICVRVIGNEVCFKHDNENMHGIFLHVLADIMGSSAVMVSTALIHVTGFNAFEPYILFTLFRNLRIAQL